MRIRKPGKVMDNLYFLGREESCVYLLEGGSESMIISGGMSYIVPDILQQFRDFCIDETKIKKLLILHSHFDHVGIIPFLKKMKGDLTIYGSARAWEILRMPKAIDTINTFSRDVARRVGREDILAEYDLEWRDGLSGTTVSDGDVIEIGGLEGRVYETPGHSSCSISFYVPELKALFPSDGAGIPFGNTIFATGNSNFTQYQASLERIKDLEVEYLFADHYGYIRGNEARNFIKQSIEYAKEYRALLEDKYRQTGDIDVTAREITDEFISTYKEYFLTPDIMRGVNRQILRHIAGAMQDA